MIAGHYGVAAAVKASAPQVPLWALMLATVWLDVLFVPLLLAGVETFGPAPGTTGGYGGSIIHAGYTHSLVGALLASAAFGALFARRWGRRAAIVLSAVAFSHWLLDLVVHRPDMPILPGNAGDLPLLGLGLWRVPAAAATVEAALVIAGTFLYWRAAQRVTRDGAAPAARPSSAARSPRRASPRLTALLMVLCGALVLATELVGA